MSNDSFGSIVTRTPNSDIIILSGRLSGVGDYLGSDKIGKEADPSTLAPFSGPKFTPGSPDDCGRYVYDAGTH